MAKDLGIMVEVSGVEVEEDEIELSLGLSIGGSFRKSEKTKPVKQKSVSSITFDSKLCETDADLMRENDSPSCLCRSSSLFPILNGEELSGSGVDALDPQQRKREIHALRRQEARIKRDEKQQKKGICRGRNGIVPIRANLMDDMEGSERFCKKIKVEDADEHYRTLNQNPNPSNSSAFASPPFPGVPIQFPFPPVQYVPFANGFTFPYLMPCWTGPTSSGVGDDKNVFQPVACRSFQPFQVVNALNSNANHTKPANCDSTEHNGSKCGGVKPMQSSGSPGSSSSVVSDYYSGSQQGRSSSSSDTRSNSSHSPSNQPQLHASVIGNALEQSENSASSHPIESTQVVEETNTDTDKVVSSNTTHPSPRKVEEEPISVTNPLPVNKADSAINKPPTPPRANADSNKPPKPQLHPRPQLAQTQSLPQMPCVSTTGNGPNGKTITGFLYRYTKTDVSIMCVCHGSSFSPAEFVKHAGGTDVSHPLKHIVVVPSPLG